MQSHSTRTTSTSIQHSGHHTSVQTHPCYELHRSDTFRRPGHTGACSGPMVQVSSHFYQIARPPLQFQACHTLQSSDAGRRDSRTRTENTKQHLLCETSNGLLTHWLIHSNTHLLSLNCQVNTNDNFRYQGNSSNHFPIQTRNSITDKEKINIDASTQDKVK